MKKSVLLVLASAALMMAACGNKPTPSKSSPADTSEEGTSITSEGETTSEGTSEEDVVCVESIGASTSLSLEEGESVKFEVEISPANAPQGFTVTSTSEEVAYYDNGYVVAGKAGTATLTITSEGVDLTGEHLVTTTTVTVEKAVIPLPTIVDTDIEATQAFTNSNENKLYRFSGILEDLDHTDKYGNAYVTDPASGKSVKIYGMTTTAEGTFVWNEAGTALEYKNPKDAVTTLAEVNNGELVTVYGIYTSQYKNFSVVLESHEAATTTYKASVGELENGTITLSKSEGIAYGEEITATVTPATDYKVEKVTIDHGFGQKDVLTAEGDGSYKFTATVNNVVEATFVSSTAIVTELTLTVDSLGLASSAYGSVDSVVSGVSISVKDTGNYGDGIQMRGPTSSKNNPPSYFYNTTATPYAIKSIKGVWSTTKNAPNYEWFACIAGAKDAAIDAAPSDANAVNVAANEGNIQLDFEEAADIHYFTFGHSGTKGKGGTFYFASVIVELYAPEA